MRERWGVAKARVGAIGRTVVSWDDKWLALATLICAAALLTSVAILP